MARASLSCPASAAANSAAGANGGRDGLRRSGPGTARTGAVVLVAAPRRPEPPSRPQR